MPQYDPSQDDAPVATPDHAYFRKPDGSVVAVSRDQAHLFEGDKEFQPVSRAAYLAEQPELKTTGQAFKAFGEGAADALTLGLSTGLERLWGVDPEMIKARELAQAGPHGLGTVAAMLAPLGGEEELASKGLKGGGDALEEGAEVLPKGPGPRSAADLAQEDRFKQASEGAMSRIEKKETAEALRRPPISPDSPANKVAMEKGQFQQLGGNPNPELIESQMKPQPGGFRFTPEDHSSVGEIPLNPLRNDKNLSEPMYIPEAETIGDTPASGESGIPHLGSDIPPGPVSSGTAGQSWAQAARGMAPGLISKLGKETTNLLEKYGADLLPDGTLSRLGQRTISSAAGSAVEGAAYGLGQSVHEEMLGDPGFSAEALAANVGSGSLAGGLFGAVGGLGRGAWEEVLANKPSWATDEKFPQWLTNQTALQNIKSIGGTGKDIGKIQKLIDEAQACEDNIKAYAQLGVQGSKMVGEQTARLEKIRKQIQLPADLRAYRLVENFTTPNKAYTRAAELKARVGSNMEETIKQIQEEIDENHPEAAPNVLGPDGLFDKARQEILLNNKVSLADPNAASKFSDLLDKYENSFKADSEIRANWLVNKPGVTVADIASNALNVPLKDLWTMRQDLDGLIKWDSTTSNGFRDTVKQFRNMVSDHINQSADAATETNKGLNEMWTRQNRAYQAASLVSTIAGKALNRSPGSMLPFGIREAGAAGLGALHSGPLGIALGIGTAALHKLSDKYGNPVASSVLDWTRKQIVGERANLSTPEAFKNDVQALTKRYLERQKDFPDETFEERRDKVNALALQERINSSTLGKIQDIAANVADKGAKLIKATMIAGATDLSDAREHINAMASNPQMLMDSLSQHAGDLEDHAPNTAQAFNDWQVRAINYLAQFSPQKIQQGIFTPPEAKTSADKEQFARIYKAVVDPLGAWEDGQFDQQSLDAIKATSPQLYSQLTQALLHEVGEQYPKVPDYQTQLMISKITGVDVSGSIAQLPFLQGAHKIGSGGGANVPGLKGPSMKTGGMRTMKFGFSDRAGMGMMSSLGGHKK